MIPKKKNKIDRFSRQIFRVAIRKFLVEKSLNIGKKKISLNFFSFPLQTLFKGKGIHLASRILILRANDLPQLNLELLYPLLTRVGCKTTKT